MASNERSPDDIRSIDVRTIRTLLVLLLAGLIAWPAGTLGAGTLSAESDALRGANSPIYVEYVPDAGFSEDAAVQGTLSPIARHDDPTATAVVIAAAHQDEAEMVRGDLSPIV
jgi:hypothetical protein